MKNQKQNISDTKQKTKSTLTAMLTFTLLLGCLTIILFILANNFHKALLSAFAITFLTTFYHFAMRLITGEVITLLFKNKAFRPNSMFFRTYGFEDKLYRKLKVKKWKGAMLTAKPEQFDLKTVSVEELLHNIMQAELVHRVIMLLSFVPLLFIIPFGTPLVFILTSIAACLIDMVFVIIQRYNRPRVLRLLKIKVSK